jgi:membrane fusion protein, multidrug efflux system
MSQLYPLIALILFVLVTSCNSPKKETANIAKPAVFVDVTVAQIQDFKTNLEVNGAVISNELIELHPEVSGRLILLNIPDGGIVKKGTVLAKINDADLQAQMTQYKSQLELAIKTEKRLNDLLKINGVNQADYDLALNQLNVIKANVAYTEAQLDKTVIKAPFAGELGLRMVSPGAYVTPQTIIGTLGQNDKVKIDFAVPESYFDLIQKGNIILVKGNGSKDTLTATISAIDPQVNTISRNIKVRALLGAGKLSPGSFVKVILENSRKTIIVPSNSIISEGYVSQVVVVKKGKAIFKTVETNLRNANSIEITKGLVLGDSVVVSGMLYVRPNTKVKVQHVKTLAELN